MVSFSIQDLRDRLMYCPNSGVFTWRNREDASKSWNARFSGKEAFTYQNKRGYKTTNIRFESCGNPVPLLAHRVAWALIYNEWPSGQIDHINGDKADNRICNLRDVVNAENAKNMALKSSNKTGVSGVYLHKQTGKWCAQINAFGKTVGLGLFEKKGDAVIARKAAERVLGYHENHGRKAN